MRGPTNPRVLRTIPVLILVCLVGFPAHPWQQRCYAEPIGAKTSTYVFDPNQSTVVQTGGIAYVHWTYSIEGQFELAVDPNAGTASFARVDANATDDSPFKRTLDPNHVFNMTSLLGTVLDSTTISFAGKADDGSDILITVTIEDDLVYLVGQTTPPPHTADFFIFNLDAVAERKYGGGTGEPNDPYQIATTEDLMLLGKSPEDYDKHFILTRDIDLDPNLPGRKVFDRAVIAPDTNDVEGGFQGNPFTGILDGNGHTISHLTIRGGEYLGLFGQTGSGASISNLALEAVDVGGSYYVGGLVGLNKGSIAMSSSTGTVSGDHSVGGLVGGNGGSITASYSTATVSGDDHIGGLAGENSGSITTSYSMATVTGDYCVGGLVGGNRTMVGCATVTHCYSIGTVTGSDHAGGLVGRNLYANVTHCYSAGTVSSHHYVGGFVGSNNDSSITLSFWDTETSGLLNMCGSQVDDATGCDDSYGKTTSEMQIVSTFLEAGWDFAGESENGTEDIWTICEGIDYPRLAWEPNCIGCTHEDYLEWVAVGKPQCWCYPTQCHGDADGLVGGSAKSGYYHVGPADLNVFISAWLVKEPPRGPGIASIPNGICADFAHDHSGSEKTGLYRVGTSDLCILVNNWLVKEPPHGPGLPADCSDCQ